MKSIEQEDSISRHMTRAQKLLVEGTRVVLFMGIKPNTREEILALYAKAVDEIEAAVKLVKEFEADGA